MRAFRRSPLTISNLKQLLLPVLALLVCRPAAAAEAVAYIGPGAGLTMMPSLAIVALIFAIALLAPILFVIRFIWQLIAQNRRQEIIVPPALPKRRRQDSSGEMPQFVG